MKNVSILFLAFLFFIHCEGDKNPIINYNNAEIQTRLVGFWYSQKGERYVFNQDNFYYLQFEIFENPVSMLPDTIDTAIEGNYEIKSGMMNFSDLHIIKYGISSSDNDIILSPIINLKSRIPYFEGDTCMRFEYIELFEGKDYINEIWKEWKKKEWLVYYDREQNKEYSGLREYTYNFTTNKNQEGFYICEVSYINHFENHVGSEGSYKIPFKYICQDKIIINNIIIMIEYKNKNMIWTYPDLSDPYYKIK